MSAYPLLFTPVYQDYIWGGNRISEHYGRELPAGLNVDCIAESWEVSDRPEGMSIVANGPHKGMNLTELLKSDPVQLLGTEYKGLEDFPLLIKILDANKTLSVQVHPNDRTAKAFGGEAKTEIWYILEAKPGAKVYCGLQTDVTADSLRKSIEEGTVETQLVEIPVSAGDVIFVPGGRVHAIDSGCLILEVQQNSNTTYRLYDWGRKGHDGNPRELHVEKALEVISFGEPIPEPLQPTPVTGKVSGAHQIETLIDCPWFHLDRLQLKADTTYSHQIDPAHFQVYFVESGSIEIEGNGESVIVPEGRSCLLPAGIGTISCTAKQDTVLVRIQ